ncbi:MAG: hypothetical protein A2X94_15995 [Bdellovibrionales bacterium GWB1_55_8]|nr:MAG: hypothetical protein A2X94_15995 [Bdellovibrionales bacterium GWB1_55_8]
MEASLSAERHLGYSPAVRLVDFLILLLETHAQALQRLAALFGEDILIEMIERSEEDESQPKPVPPPAGSFVRPKVRGIHTASSAYSELESAVRDMKLPSVLEFYLWAYPHYRAFIESPLDLNSRIQSVPGSEPDASTALVDEAIAQAQAWVRKLPITPEFSVQAERAVHAPWVRFRTTVLTRIGKRPVGSVI